MHHPTFAATHCLTTHSSRSCFATRLNSSVRAHSCKPRSSRPSSLLQPPWSRWWLLHFLLLVRARTR
ncbi:hypothetical protein XarjCFBP7653_00140 [Xanthomonas arboricola]|nr:hypothetical protein XarjCFBP7653_00140 [Xanthomonas arboricola]